MRLGPDSVVVPLLALQVLEESGTRGLRLNQRSYAADTPGHRADQSDASERRARASVFPFYLGMDGYGNVWYNES